MSNLNNISDRTSSTSGTAATAARTQIWRGSDMKRLSSSYSSMVTQSLQSFSCFWPNLTVSHRRSQIQEPTEEEILCELHKHPHLNLQR